jgi:hypothetical protein
MQFLWRRYARSGYAPPWFYLLAAIGFLALAIWGAVQNDWLIMAIAIVMIPVTIAGSRLMQRLSIAADASRRELDQRRKDDDHAGHATDHRR